MHVARVVVHAVVGLTLGLMARVVVIVLVVEFPKPFFCTWMYTLHSTRSFTLCKKDHDFNDTSHSATVLESISSSSTINLSVCFVNKPGGCSLTSLPILTSINSSDFDITSEQLVELKWLMLNKHKKMIAVITCEISLCQYVCELVLVVNVLDLDLGVQINSMN